MHLTRAARRVGVVAGAELRLGIGRCRWRLGHKRAGVWSDQRVLMAVLDSSQFLLTLSLSLIVRGKC